MRKFENIKPLSQVSYRKREIPEYEIGGFFKTVAKPFILLGTWAKSLFTTNGQNTDTATVANTTSKPASVEDSVKISTSNVTTLGSPTKSASSNVGVNQNVSSTSTLSTSVMASTIPVPPSTEEIAKSNLTKQSNPDNATYATSATLATLTTKLEENKQSATDAGLQVADASKQIKDTIKNKDLTGGQKFRAIAKAGAGIVGAVGSTAANILNPGLQTNLASDTDVNAGMDIAANIVGLLGPYGKLAEFGIKGAQAIGNTIAGNMKPKFSIDKDLQARQNASYMDTFKQVDKLSLGPGLSGVLFGSGEWRNKWQDAQAKYELTKGIDATSQDAQAAGRYEGIGMANAMDLNGGFTSLRAAKYGMKIESLKFAKQAVNDLNYTHNLEKFTKEESFQPKEKVLEFKEGGSFNVIPEGALHKNKHNMDDADGLTKKGIPVVTIEDGEKILQAEIEVNEIIFRLEVTELLEKLAKENTDEAAIEAGKLLTKEILHNTHDNTGLIKEIN